MPNTPAPEEIKVGAKTLPFTPTTLGTGVFAFQSPHVLNNDKNTFTAQLDHIVDQRDAANQAEQIVINYTVLDDTHKKHAVQATKRDTEKYSITYRNIFERSPNPHANTSMKKIFPKPLLPSPFFLGPSSCIPPQQPTCSLALLTGQAEAWRTEWDKSQSKQTISKFFTTHASRLSHIDKVYGIGLSRPGTRALLDSSCKEETAYFQHLTVVHIADEICRTQGHAVEVFVQDPVYTSVCREFLTQEFPGLRVVQDPDVFRGMDGASCVFSCHMHFDVGEVAMRAAGGRGLAGMMGSRIVADHQELLGHAVLGPGWLRPDLVRLTSSMVFAWAKGCVECEVGREKSYYGQDGLWMYLRLKDA